MTTDSQPTFEAFFETAEPPLRLALVGAFGPELGREATAEALTWAWQNWERLREMENPVGYLYTVGRSVALKEVRLQAHHFVQAPNAEADTPDFEPMLSQFLSELSEHQRVAVWMVHGMGYKHVEVAEILGCSTPTVATHVRRALAKLRSSLEVDLDV